MTLLNDTLKNHEKASEYNILNDAIAALEFDDDQETATQLLALLLADALPSAGLLAARYLVSRQVLNRWTVVHAGAAKYDGLDRFLPSAEGATSAAQAKRRAAEVSLPVTVTPVYLEAAASKGHKVEPGEAVLLRYADTYDLFLRANKPVEPIRPRLW